MRETIQISTYDRVKALFAENKNREFSRTSIRDELRIDFHSVKMVLDRLLIESFITQSGSRFKYKKR
jgi:hypothetical protein